MPEFFHDIEQNTDEWRVLRIGLITASEMKSVIAKGEGKMRDSLIRRIAAEKVTQIPLESYTNDYMERGKKQEAEARSLYALQMNVDVQRVGFIRNGRTGASPDSLVGNDGGVEIKTQRADLLIDTWQKNIVPTEHVCQLQGTLLVSERDWWDLAIYAPGMPLFKKRVGRDERYIANLRGEIDRCYEEIELLVRRINGWGVL